MYPNSIPSDDGETGIVRQPEGENQQAMPQYNINNADWRGLKYNPISAYEIFMDMCLIERYPCVAVVPVRTHGWNDGGKPMYYYYVVGCDYNEDGDCWYNEE